MAFPESVGVIGVVPLKVRLKPLTTPELLRVELF
jgi:hypothetical protein